MSNKKITDYIHTTSKGVTVTVHTNNQAVADMCFKHYENYQRLNMNCPFCQADLWGNSLDGERNGDKFEDCYTCDDCDVLVTLITPAHCTEYWQVPDGAEDYLIEFMHSGEPSTWDEHNA